MKTTDKSRHILLHLEPSARLPDALLGAMRDEVVLSGWIRGGGVLADVRLRALGEPRRISGPVQAAVIDGALGFAGGDVTCALRVVLSRETDSGLETIAGELIDAEVVSLDALVIALDEIVADRPEPAPAPAPAPPASDPAERFAPPPKPAAPSIAFGSPQPIPQRPARPKVDEDDDAPYPEPGDLVEHFAFGRCEVVKSDGDRLHVRLGKDGRIKEIALEMLKVTPLPEVEGAPGNHFRLDRRL